MVTRPAVATVVFVDLVRFTSFTEIHGDVTAADAAETLAHIVRESLASGTELVKLLGDGAMLVAQEPVDGLRTAANIIERLHDGSAGLDARGGLHHGEVASGGVMMSSARRSTCRPDWPPRRSRACWLRHAQWHWRAPDSGSPRRRSGNDR
jgi:class 3 adenylate cyclase